MRVPVYLTPKQTEFLIEQAERQRWFWHRKAKAATDGRIYNYWNAEETWERIRDSAMAALKRYEAMNGGGEA